MSAINTITEVDEFGNVSERPMTQSEIDQKLADQAEIAAQIAAAEAKEAARQSRREKLLALGLTEEELDA